jgi:peptidoglycan/LPS O-acetylase OafA/YrhL
VTSHPAAPWPYWRTVQAWPPPRAQQAQISRLPYTPGLDGLRALAVIAVMVYHANHAWLPGGFLGVEVFFVLSGYLITLLLIGEHERKGKIGLKRFWLRRARRLLPALLVLLAGTAIYLAFFNRAPQGQARGDFVGAATYGSNWYQIVVGQGYTAAQAFAPLRHLWSLAVEEQFYLVWPLVMVVVLRTKAATRLPKLGLWLFGLSAALAVLIGVLYQPGDVATTCGPTTMHGYWTIGGRCINVNEALYLGTFTRAGGVLLGAAMATWWRPVAILRGPLRDKPRRLDLLALFGLVGLWLLVTGTYLSENGVDLGLHYDPWLFRGGLFLTGLATLAIIAAVTHRRSWTGKALGNPVLRWIGQRSYGLYLYHWLIYQIIRKEAGIDLTVEQFAVAMVATVVVAELSYRLVEMPVRTGRFGEWLRGQRVARTRKVYNRRRWMVALAALAAGFVGFAGVSIATADDVCVGALQCSLQSAGGAAPASIPPAPTTTTALPSTTTTSTTIAAVAPVAPVVSVAEAMARAVPPPGQDPLATAPSTTVVGAPTSAPASGTSIGAPVPIATSVAPTTAVAPTVEPTTTGPPVTEAVTVTSVQTQQAGPPPLAVGESVMQGATNQLAAGGFQVDAQQSRQGTDIAGIVESYRAQGQIGSIVVLQVGTNGSVSDATYDRIMASLPAATTPYVFFMTVRAPRGWIDANNARINALPLRYPNVHIIDWSGISQAKDVKLCSDGFHIACSPTSEQTYANIVFESIGRPDLAK